jgi:hypothetical protein
MKALAIETIKRERPNQWLLVEVTETKHGTPSKGVVLKASNSRQEIVEEIGKNKDKKLFFFFSGITASPNTAFALYLQPE